MRTENLYYNCFWRFSLIGISDEDGSMPDVRCHLALFSRFLFQIAFVANRLSKLACRSSQRLRSLYSASADYAARPSRDGRVRSTASTVESRPSRITPSPRASTRMDWTTGSSTCCDSNFGEGDAKHGACSMLLWRGMECGEDNAWISQ